MGRYKNSCIGKGIGTSPQLSLENQEYENKIFEIEEKKSLSDYKNVNNISNNGFDIKLMTFEENKNKIENYLLNLNNEKGKSKAKFFIEVLGYSNNNSKQFYDNLIDSIKNKIAIKIVKTEYGEVREFHEKIKSISGKYEYANIVIVVQKDNGKTSYRFITAYPDKKGDN